MKITFSIITLLVISCLTFSQTIERSYTVQLQIPAGTSATYSIPISDAPSNGVITGVEAKFEYIAYNGAQSYLSARFNRGSDPGPSGGVLLVAQGNLPPGNPGTYGYIPFSNWNGNGVNTNYYFRFTVAAGSPYNPTIVRIWTKVNYNIPPPVPIPVRPLANAQIYSQTPTFQWQYVPNQTDFRLVIYNHPSGAQQYIQINQTGGSSNSYTLNQAQKLEAGDYWWKVNIATPSGTSPYTSLIHFTVTAPIPIAPVNQTVNTSRPTFSWSTIPNQTHFRVAIYNHPSGGDPYMVRNYEGGSSNSWKCDVDLPNGQYWWKVNVAVSTEAGNSPYCELKTFSVQTTQLNLVSPTYNQNIYGGNIVLQWTNVNADSYHVYVDNNIIPGPPGVYSSPEINKKKVTTNNYIIDEYFLECNQTFYWRIVAFLPGGTQINSDVGVFNYYFGQNLEPQPIWAPLYRLYKSADKDHFYCVSPEQRQIAINQGYKDERIEGHISVKPFNDLNMVNIFRLYHPSLKAHYYTTDGDDKDIKIQTGYTYEGIIGFAYSNNRPELIPFYQLHKDFSNPSSIDHFYTCSFPEKDNAVKVFGFIYDGIIAFISPNGNNQTLPLGPGQLEAGLGVNTANGNFRHYTKTSFNIPGKGIPLVFEHFYNSNSVWLYAGIIPLSPGWSHSYNSYVVTLNPEEVNQNVAVVWPDGSIKEYYYNGTNYAPQTPGDYDIFNVIAGVTHFTIKKKDQSIYTFMTPPGAPFGYPAMLTSIKDRNNNITSLSYETSPIIRLKEVTDPSGRKFTFNYYTESGKEYLIKNVIDNTGNRTIQFIYDEQNRLVQFKDAENRITEYLYDSTWEQFHLLSKITLPKGNVIDISYQTDPDPDGIGMRVNQQLINGGNQVNFSYNYSTKSTTVSDANNIQYRYEYNSNSLITNVYNETLSKVDKFWYQDPDNPTKPTQTQDKNGNYSTFQYDLRGNVLQINQVAGGKTITHKYQYDAMNNITKYTDPRNKVTDFVYDNNGNLISVTDTRGTTNYSRNSFGKVESITNPLSHTTNLGYNSYGNLTTITDPLSNTTSLTYDAISRLKSVLNPKNQNTQYSYDKTDLLLTITDAFNNNTTYSYDANSNLTNILNARGFSTNFGYDNFERLISKAEPSSNPTQFSYRSNGQIASRTNPDGSTVTYSYNADRISGISSNNVNATFNYDGNGNITSVIESGNYKGSGTLSFSYDEINRLTGYTDFYSKSVGYTYDESGNILSITYPGNKTVFYTYYDDNRLSSVKDWNGKTTTYNYRNDGSLYQISYPNGVVVTYSYDNAERITGINISG
ncbi:MAG TPA: DUF6531 domain-containing protein [Ignavibacteriaceae bacterium]|nr:DUF6531 domain-containing protein [Ignavibacteriaceae bacterium]